MNTQFLPKARTDELQDQPKYKVNVRQTSQDKRTDHFSQNHM